MSAVLVPIQSVGVMGDERSYESVVAIRAAKTQDFMTADGARLPHDVLATISNRVINEVSGVNRVGHCLCESGDLSLYRMSRKQQLLQPRRAGWL